MREAFREGTRFEGVNEDGKDTVVEVWEQDDSISVKIGYSQAVFTTGEARELARRLYKISRLVSGRRSPVELVR